jgi:hypothetical protein
VGVAGYAGRQQGGYTPPTSSLSLRLSLGADKSIVRIRPVKGGPLAADQIRALGTTHNMAWTAAAPRCGALPAGTESTHYLGR